MTPHPQELAEALADADGWEASKKTRSPHDCLRPGESNSIVLAAAYRAAIAERDHWKQWAEAEREENQDWAKRLKARAEAAESSLSQAGLEISRLKANVSLDSQALEASRKERDKWESVAMALKSDYDEVRKELAESRAESKQWAEDLHKAALERDEVRAEVERLKADLNGAKGSLGACRMREEALKVQVAALQARIATLAPVAEAAVEEARIEYGPKLKAAIAELEKKS